MLAIRTARWLEWWAGRTFKGLGWLLPVLFVALATGSRLWPLQSLGGRLAWLTYYPAVMVAALFGGVWAGLLAATLACLCVSFLLPAVLGVRFLADRMDLLGMAVFFSTSMLMAVLAESTRRARAREQQAENERDRFFSLSLDMLCISNADGYFRRLNPAFSDTLGWDLAELLRQPFISLVHPDDCAATLAAVADQIQRGLKVLQFENRYRHRDGSYRWLSWKSVPQPGGFMYATARDITELKAAEEALRRSEESLAVTLQSIGDAVLATDLEGRITRMNPVAEKLMGWSQAEALGRPVAEVFQIINEVTRMPGVVPVSAVLATGQIHGLANHTVLIARNGVETPIADSAAPIRTLGGEMLGVILVFRDVTEEKRAEALVRESSLRLQAANEDLERRVEARTAEVRQALATLDATEDGAFIFEPDSLRFTYVNEGAVLQLGYPRAALLTMTLMDLQPQLVAADLRRQLAPVLGGELRAYQYTSTHRHRDGRDIPVENNLQYIAPAGQAARFICISRDITERLKNENLAFRAQRLDSIGTLAGGVAHDLNNALAPILMGVEVLHLKYPADHGLVDLFEASAKRGAALVRQLLSFARGAEGQRVSIRTSLLVTELLAMVAGSFPKNIQVLSELEPDLPALWGDPTQVEQVLLNLCVNARDAMPEGGALSVAAYRVHLAGPIAGAVPNSRPGAFVAMRVTDTGGGIAPEILERIFEPFFSTKGTDQGTGLGLPTVMGILKSHSGFLQVDSTPGMGSRFTVYFPVDPAELGTAPEAMPAFTWSGLGRTLLVVDDEGPIRAVAQLVLQRLGFEVLCAADGYEGLRQVRAHGWALSAVLLDLHMPGLDGLGLARELRDLQPGLPLLVASGRLEAKDREAFAELGVTCFLDKPYSEAQLAGQLGALLGLAKV